MNPKGLKKIKKNVSMKKLIVFGLPLVLVSSHQTFVALEDVLKTSSRHVLKTSSKCLQRNNFSSSKTSWRRLEDVLKTSSRHVFKTSSRHVFKTSSRRLPGMFYWEYLLLKNLKSVSDKSVSHISECKMH